MIALASDHHGVALKQEMIRLLDEMGLAWKDFGSDGADNRNDDYPVYGYRAALAVASGECDRGILICGTGMGISIAAGKVKGIRVCVRRWLAAGFEGGRHQRRIDMIGKIENGQAPDFRKIIHQL